MRPVMRVLVTAVLLLASLGCSRREPPAPKAPAKVSATRAFESAFGPAPVTDKGTCFAFVIYFPSAKNPGKLTPFPFFSFDRASLKKVALERMMGGMDEKSYAGEFLRLFPAGSRLISLTEQGGVVTADYSAELAAVAADPARGGLLKQSVVLTLAQFPAVTGVRIRSAGQELFPQVSLPLAEEDLVAAPGPPRLLSVIAMQDSAAGPVKEVDALFDRPVDIKEFQFEAIDGSVIAGEVFHSMFDMAAVLKPKDPARLRGTASVRVRYRVVDKLGRPAAGEGALPLEVRLHQD